MESLEEKRFREIVEELLTDQEELFLVEVKVKGNSGNQKVLIFVDGDNGISIDQCGKISRQVGAILEEDDFMEGKYLLEVSSPGLDHPLTLHRQYLKNIGRKLSVETTTGNKIEGKLERVEERSIFIEGKDSAQEINFEEINQSKIIVSFK